ncbi:hypothetical protein ACP4OV_001546 [Aristida adscensionis]
MAFSKILLVALALAITAMSLATASAQNTPQDFVNLHNQERAADKVGPVAWDAKVAKYAADYAAKLAGDCRMQHSGGPYGENLYQSGSKQASAADAVRKWVAEKAHYSYATNSRDPGQMCGHYTQVVWRKSARIGCARVVCGANRGVIIFCSYDPPGNFNNERPF